MTMFDYRTVFEKMTHQRPLPDESYPTMHNDGYSMYEIVETAKKSIMRHSIDAQRKKEAREEAKQSDVPMDVNITSEIKIK